MTLDTTLTSMGTEKSTFRNTFKGGLNVTHDELFKQIRTNIRRPLPQVQQHPPNDYKVVLLCGGPSLNDSTPTLRRLVRSGYKIACVNNTYNWALEHKFVPSVYAQLDAREHNTRFVSKPVDGCRYLLMSQVHPDLFDMLEGYDVRIWHSVNKKEKQLLDTYYMKRWRSVHGGSTIGSRSIFLLYLLGMRTVRVFGMDSCFASGQHHAYEQPENDKDELITVTVGRRKFQTTVWMVAQLDEMLQLASQVPSDFKLSFEGDGLLQYIITETARRGKTPRITMGA